MVIAEGARHSEVCVRGVSVKVREEAQEGRCEGAMSLIHCLTEVQLMTSRCQVALLAVPMNSPVRNRLSGWKSWVTAGSADPHTPVCHTFLHLRLPQVVSDSWIIAFIKNCNVAVFVTFIHCFHSFM